LNGIAGSGKTSMLRTIMKQLDEQKIKYQVLCPTNKSARVVSKDAMTIHKFLAKGFSNMKSLKKQINGLKYLIVDEISMVREMFYKVFLSIKAMSDIKFIIAGDWRQIEPVNDRAEFNYKDSLALLELCDANKLELTKCRRSDDKLFKASLQVMTLDTKKYGKTEHDISICWTNKKRIAVNDKWMKAKSVNMEKIFLPKLGYDSNSQDTIIYKGLPIIARVNCRKNDIANNETFIVKKVGDKVITITDEGFDKDIETKDFMRLFYPAYCMTCHRVQGTTIDRPFTIYEWKHFNEQLRYTAFTRGTKMENINFA
jgi:ATP-dependent exoDNAse (exonuclease V) alpha subunit